MGLTGIRIWGILLAGLSATGCSWHFTADDINPPQVIQSDDRITRHYSIVLQGTDQPLILQSKGDFERFSVTVPYAPVLMNTLQTHLSTIAPNSQILLGQIPTQQPESVDNGTVAIRILGASGKMGGWTESGIGATGTTINANVTLKSEISLRTASGQELRKSVVAFERGQGRSGWTYPAFAEAANMAMSEAISKLTYRIGLQLFEMDQAIAQ